MWLKNLIYKVTATSHSYTVGLYGQYNGGFDNDTVTFITYYTTLMVNYAVDINVIGVKTDINFNVIMVVH